MMGTIPDNFKRPFFSIYVAGAKYISVRCRLLAPLPSSFSTPP